MRHSTGLTVLLVSLTRLLPDKHCAITPTRHLICIVRADYYGTGRVIDALDFYIDSVQPSSKIGVGMSVWQTTPDQDGFIARCDDVEPADICEPANVCSSAVDKIICCCPARTVSTHCAAVGLPKLTCLQCH